MGIFKAIYWDHGEHTSPTTLVGLDELLEDHHWSMIRSTLRSGVNVYRLFDMELVIVL